MSYMQPFGSVVTTSKRNNIYYGPTESSKMHSNFSEILTDLWTIYHEMQAIKDGVDSLADEYLLPSGVLVYPLPSGYSIDSNSLYDLKRQIYDLEERFNRRMYVRASQAEVL